MLFESYFTQLDNSGCQVFSLMCEAALIGSIIKTIYRGMIVTL